MTFDNKKKGSRFFLCKWYDMKDACWNDLCPWSIASALIKDFSLLKEKEQAKGEKKGNQCGFNCIKTKDLINYEPQMHTLPNGRVTLAKQNLPQAEPFKNHLHAWLTLSNTESCIFLIHIGSYKLARLPKWVTNQASVCYWHSSHYVHHIVVV